MNPDANIATPALTQDASGSQSPQPPVARREPTEHVLHGDRRMDHYAWLRHKENPDVTAYLEAENAYTDATLAPTAGFQEKLYQEMLGRIQQTDLSVPYRLRGFSISRERRRASSIPSTAAAATRRVRRKRSCST